MRKILYMSAAPIVLALAACGSSDNDADQPVAEATPSEPENAADAMASRDPAPGEQAPEEYSDDKERPIMHAQVVLDRLGFSPGVVDGKMGLSTENALVAYQKSQGLEETGEYDDATKQSISQYSNITATRIVTIPEDFAVGRFEKIPDDPQEQAKLQKMGYESLDEKLAERFHTTIETLKELNPNGQPAGMQTASSDGTMATPSPTASASPTPTPTPTPSASGSTAAKPGPKSVFAAGQKIRVPNIGADFISASADVDSTWKETLRTLGVGSDQPKAARLVGDESDKTLYVYDDADKLIAAYTITSGSSNDPLPVGEWGITGVGKNPPFSYDPDLFWDVPDSNPDVQLPPGPNGPVGVVWIDLTKEHYGIHGTPEPETIGRAQSHGCVRLTNWDAARLAQMVSTNTKVVFQK